MGTEAPRSFVLLFACCLALASLRLLRLHLSHAPSESSPVCGSRFGIDSEWAIDHGNVE